MSAPNAMSAENPAEGGILRGRLSDVGLPTVLAVLRETRRTGMVSLVNAGVRKSIYFLDGRLVFAASSLTQDRLGEVLLRGGKISADEYLRLSQRIRGGQRLGKALVESGVLSPKDLWWAIEHQIKEIVWSIFNWEDGYFHFEEDDLPRREKITFDLDVTIVGNVGFESSSYHLGLAYLKVGRNQEAARELEAALGMMGMRRETRLKEPMVLIQAAIAYVEMGNFKAARQKVDLALEREPSDPDAYYILGRAAREQGEEDVAAKAFAAALEIDRDHPEANIALAEWRVAQGKTELAQENLRHASHGTTENFEILMSLGALAFRLGDLDEAEESFIQALARRPTNEDARFNLGTIQLAQRKYADAIENLHSLTMRPEPHDEASFNLALALQYTEDYAEAREVLEILLERNRDFEGASFSLAIVSEAMGDVVAAETAYREAIRKRPQFVPALLNLAALLERLDRPDEARSTLELPLDEEQAQAIREAIQSLE